MSLEAMRADICDPNDAAAVAKFRDMLCRMGGQLDGKDWAIGVDRYRLNIGGEELSVFCDAWSLDVEGPEALVRRVLDEYTHTKD